MTMPTVLRTTTVPVPDRSAGQPIVGSALDDDPSTRVWALLTAGVPLSLLMDLADSGNPHSAALARAEGCDDIRWLRAG